jgi:pimeloyl-ACP methyl ester carboxylesterase
MAPLLSVRAGVLDVSYFSAGPADGPPVLLMHGFPYDIHAYAEVAPVLAAAGCRVIAPYLRGFGGTRFLSADTPRSGEQAALGADLLALLDALGIQRAVLAGYDWGGRAACVVAALWPERCAGLVSTFTASAAGLPCRPTGKRSADCCGSCGPPAGVSMTPPLSAVQRPLKTQTSSRS